MIEVLALLGSYILIYINFKNIKDLRKDRTMNEEKQYTLDTLRNMLLFATKSDAWLKDWGKKQERVNSAFNKAFTDELQGLYEKVLVDLHFLPSDAEKTFNSLIKIIRNTQASKLNNIRRARGGVGLEQIQEQTTSKEQIKQQIETNLKAVIKNKNFSWETHEWIN